MDIIELQKVKVIINSAYGFYNSAKFSIKYLNENDKEWSKFLPVAAVNTSFCIELILKAIHKSNLNKVSGHNISVLFENLPKNERLLIDDIFKIKRFQKSIYSGNAYVYASTYKNTPIAIKLDNVPSNLSELFKFHELAFVSFRYNYEQTPGSKPYLFEWEVLLSLIETLFEYIENKIQI